MARQNASGRAGGSAATKNAPGNQTPNTPEVNESEIARLKVDQLRDRLRRRGITGTAGMRKPELVDALVRALREGRPTTRSAGRRGAASRSSSGPGSRSNSRSGSRRATGSRRGGTGEQPGNQTPNTPEVNESEIARLKVDQLRDRLRRRGITGTAGMRKPELVDALIRALREGRPTTRSAAGRGSGTRQAGSGSRRTAGRAEAGVRTDELANVERQVAELAEAPPERPEVEQVERRAAELEDTGNGRRRTGEPEQAALDAPEVEEVERRAAELADAPPERPEVEEVERRAAELAETPADRFGSTAVPTDLAALPAGDQPGSSGGRPGGPATDSGAGGPVPRPRSGDDARDRQPVRSAADGSRSGPSLAMETADRVVTSMVPPEVTGVDQVVTPEGTMVTTSADESVGTPPLPGTAGR